MADAAQGHPASVPIVTESPDGEMGCAFPVTTTHSDVWCGHKQEYMKSGLDVREFWDSRTVDLNPEWDAEYHLKVPITPSYGMWADVAICRLKGVWVLVLQRNLKDPSKLENMRLGITGPSEGRAAWRAMIIDYWRGQCDAKLPKCGSKGHSYEAQVQWTQALMLDKADISYHLNLWTAWYHDLCYRCWQVRNNIVSDEGPDHDLVPDDQKTTNWNSLRSTRSSHNVVTGMGRMETGGSVWVNGKQIGHLLKGNHTADPNDPRVQGKNDMTERSSYELSGEY